MDTITHGIAGAVFGRSLTDRPGARIALVVGAVAAMLPDLDVVYISSRIGYLREHRGWTHSFLVMPFLALAVALVAKLFARRARLPVLWVFAAVGITSHILFDWITSFGTMFWTPVSRGRHSLDWVFILDPWFTGIVLVALLFALRGPDARARRIAAAGSVLLFLYIGVLRRDAREGARDLETARRAAGVGEGRGAAAVPLAVSLARDSPSGRTRSTTPSSTSARSPGASRTRGRRKSGARSSRAFATAYPPPERARIHRFARPSPTRPSSTPRAPCRTFAPTSRSPGFRSRP